MNKVTNLTTFSIQSNRITKIENIENLSMLDDFYISHNGIKCIEGLKNNKELTTLDIAGNYIDKLENLDQLHKLEELWCNDNHISDWNEIRNIEHMKNLATVYFERNPIQKNADYRRKLKLALPSLSQIDATLCR